MHTLRPIAPAGDESPHSGLPLRWVVILILVAAAAIGTALLGGGVVGTITVGATIMATGHKVIAR